MKTTLNRIQANCPDPIWFNTILRRLGKTQVDDEPLSISDLLDSPGNAIWALQTAEGFNKEIRLFACDCAESVLSIFEKHYPNDDRPRKSIEVARKYANGEASMDELHIPRVQAWEAAKMSEIDLKPDEVRASADAARYVAEDFTRSGISYRLIKSWGVPLERQLEILNKYL